MLSNCSPMVTMCLAAAVSDYWMPPEEKSMHEIKSSASVVLNLQPVHTKIN